jgi:uncharacterized protein (UPF0332 family)
MSTPMSQPFDPTGFFSFAGSIVRDANANEAALRSAISRVYYSIYLVARDNLFGRDETQLTSGIKKRIVRNYQLRTQSKKRELGTHERVIFAVLDRTNNITLSQQLDQLREARVNADYKMSQKYLTDIRKKSWREYAEETMQLATLVLPIVKRLPSY